MGQLLTSLPGWGRVVVALGVPGLAVGGLLLIHYTGVITMAEAQKEMALALQGLVKSMERHEYDERSDTAILRRICLNVAKTQEERMRCVERD